MTLPVAVVDTNVVVSGLIVSRPTSPPAMVLDAMLGGRFTYLLSLDLLAEYRAVLLRPAIRRRHGLSGGEVNAILTELALNGTVSAITWCPRTVMMSSAVTTTIPRRVLVESSSGLVLVGVERVVDAPGDPACAD